MNRIFKLSMLLIVGAILFAGCASETTAPVDPVVQKGSVTPMIDRFMATIGDATDSLYFVYTPPGYDANRAEAYPVVYMLNGFGGSETYFVYLFSATDGADWLLSKGLIEPMVLVFPSGHNAFGGGFYTNSGHPAVGQAETHILNIITEVEASFNVMADPSGRGLGGHSMGGFGAMSIALNNPNMFGNVSVLAAPISFWGTKTTPPHSDETYKGIEEVLPSVLLETGYAAVLQETGGVGDAARFQELMVPTADKRVTSMMFAMAAAFSPTVAPGSTTIIAYGVDLPIGLDGNMDMATWTRWMAYDPVSRFAGGQYANLAGVNIWLDAGLKDDLGLYGAHQTFAGAMAQAGMTPDSDTYYNGIVDSEGTEIKADHTTYTFERIKRMLIWQSSKF